MNQQNETHSPPDTGAPDKSATPADRDETVRESSNDQPPNDQPGNGESGEDHSVAAPSADEPEKASKSGAGAIGWLSLIVALLAAASAGYVAMEQRAQRNLGERIANFQSDLNARAAALNELTGDAERLDEQLNSLTARFDQQLEDLPVRLDRLERTVDNIPGVANDVRSAWLRAEAEYFLRIANAQLNLAGNVDISMKALDLADEKLKVLGDPRLTQVRALISDELAALSAVPRPDGEGIVLTLGSLARSLDSLPLAQRAPERFDNRQTPNEEESGLARAWRVIVDALLSIITVKRDDDSITPLMSDADESTLIRSLDVELQIARLAVIRSDADLYRRSLTAVTERLERHFDTNAPAVESALATVKELSAVQIPESLPDISGSLALLLRQRGEATTS